MNATGAAGESWWIGTSGVEWSIYWGGAAADENKPWHWDNVNNRPILWFETEVNQ